MKLMRRTILLKVNEWKISISFEFWFNINIKEECYINLIFCCTAFWGNQATCTPVCNCFGPLLFYKRLQLCHTWRVPSPDVSPPSREVQQDLAQGLEDHFRTAHCLVLSHCCIFWVIILLTSDWDLGSTFHFRMPLDFVVPSRFETHCFKQQKQNWAKPPPQAYSEDKMATQTSSGFSFL